MIERYNNTKRPTIAIKSSSSINIIVLFLFIIYNVVLYIIVNAFSSSTLLSQKTKTIKY